MVENHNETFHANLDIFRSDDCINSGTNTSNDNSNDKMIVNHNNNLSTDEKISTILPMMAVNETKEINDGNNLLNLNNIGEYSMEMLARLTSSAIINPENYHYDNNDNCTSANANATGTSTGDNGIKKQKSQKFKPSNVWRHFMRLSDGNVRCIHCGKILKRKDSSTKTMWGHLRAIHSKDREREREREQQQQQQIGRDYDKLNGIEMQTMDELDRSRIITTQNWLEQRVGILCDKTQQTQLINNELIGQLDETTTSSIESFRWSSTQPYNKRNRLSPLISNGYTANLKNINHNAINDCIYNGNSLNTAFTTFAQLDQNTEEKSRNFLSSIPHTSEIINITAGYTGNTDHRRLSFNGKLEENSNGNALAALNASNSLLTSIQNHLNATDQSIASLSTSLAHILDSFSIFDPDSMAIFMRTATDLDCTLSFHCRNNQPQLTFESNRTAANGLKGVKVCMTEMDDEVQIVVQTNGTELDKECWKKTDRAQFLWAIRGKCQKILTQ
ncbi:BED zinc finger family protein [Brugia malayi]|uniref:BED zinc finger family protein n=3 Tax=Brugia TaxID=6278 RepID=A0A4E9FGA5_BRUMA|nr:BED zinc finger family protein [Brugia malayi]VIO92331.1 BED zinc finger family protein [Brugia malayi]